MDQQRCRWHRRRPAQATCVACSSRVCAACTVHTRVGAKCRSCAGAAVAGPWRRLAAVVGAGVAIVVAALVVVIVIRSHGSDQGTQRASSPTPSAPSAPAGPATTPIPCSLDHQEMC